MLSEELKEYTKKSHVALEGRMVPSIKAIATQSDYQRLLEMMYGFYAPLEQKIDAFVNEDNMPAYNDRRKAEAILNDIKTLNEGAAIEAVTLCTDLPEVQGYTQAIGAMYVLEGSTLGGKIIAAMIQKKLGSVEGALSFFSGYGGQAMPMWNAFKEMVNSGIQNDEKKAVLKAADDTFTSFKRWIEIYEHQ